MEAFINVYGLPVAGALGIGLIWWLLSMVFKGKPEKHLPPAPQQDAQETPAVIYEPIEVLLFDSRERHYERETISGQVVADLMKTYRSLGKKWDYYGRKLFAINRYETVDESGAVTVRYRPVQAMMRATSKHPPSAVHLALHRDELPLAFPMLPPGTTLQKIMPVLIWSIGILAILWMWSQS